MCNLPRDLRAHRPHPETGEGIIANLRFHPENIKRNLELMGEAVMMELARRGVGRYMKELLMLRPEVTGYISAEEIEGSHGPWGILVLRWSRLRPW